MKRDGPSWKDNENYVKISNQFPIFSKKVVNPDCCCSGLLIVGAKYESKLFIQTIVKSPERGIIFTVSDAPT